MLKCRFALNVVVVLAAATCTASARLVVPHVMLTGCQIDSAHANALAEAIAAARDIYIELGFDMPEVVNLSIICKEAAQADLFTDGNHQLFLTIPSLSSLAPPEKSGVFNIYGMCHELGHIAMYRTLKNRDWMPDAAAEGWAHYIGSLVVDRVFDKRGKSLWPEPYDYRAEGTERLRKDVSSKSPSNIAAAAAEWQKLGNIVGLRAFMPLFRAWQTAAIESVRPWELLLPILRKLQPQNDTPLKGWWQNAAPLLVRVSEFPSDQLARADLSGQAVKVPRVDSRETSRASIGGGGEGRKFTAPGPGDWYITTVWIYGSRYGEETPSDAIFDIALCDGDSKLVSIWKGRYSSFALVQDGWTRFDVPPTRLPPTFYLTLNFRADASHGVYVAFDASSKGSSFDSLPGKPPHEFPAGDWMIGVEMDHKK